MNSRYVGINPYFFKLSADEQQTKLLIVDGKHEYMGSLGRATTTIADEFKKSKTSGNYKALYTILPRSLPREI